MVNGIIFSFTICKYILAIDFNCYKHTQMGGLDIIERKRIYSVKPYILGRKLKQCVTSNSVEHNGSALTMHPTQVLGYGICKLNPRSTGTWCLLLH